jgi:hypothetical protein
VFCTQQEKRKAHWQIRNMSEVKRRSWYRNKRLLFLRVRKSKNSANTKSSQLNRASPKKPNIETKGNKTYNELHHEWSRFENNSHINFVAAGSTDFNHN